MMMMMMMMIMMIMMMTTMRMKLSSAIKSKLARIMTKLLNLYKIINRDDTGGDKQAGDDSP